MSTPTYLAIDLETTGLDPSADLILEIAALVLDEELAELARFETVIEQPAPFSALMSDFVRDMHTKNGLIAEIEQGVAETLMPIADAIAMLERIAAQYPKRPILCGSSVHFDRSFLAAEAPELVAKLHHRHLDATTCALLQPRLGETAKPAVAHRALPDICYSVNVLRTARQMMKFLPPPKATTR